MKSLITKKEAKILKKFLDLSPLPEITFNHNELRGYIYGVAITPDVVEPAEWVPVIFGDDMPDWQDEDEAREMMGTLFTVLNKHIAAFQAGDLFLPFQIEKLKENEFESVIDWTAGFDEALALRPECWEEDETMTDEELEHLTNSLVVIEGIIYPEDAIEMFDHIPKGELLEIGFNPKLEDIDKVFQIQYFMLQALELSVETITDHAARLEALRKEKVKSSPTLFENPSHNLEKSTLCPCGSGKKFHNCCSLPPQKKKKEGKLIQVDFTQNGPEQKTMPAGKGSRDTYQLEVTISYTHPEIRRLLQVPADFTLTDLHMVVQYAIGWQDMHMHQFQIGLKFYGPQLADDYSDAIMLDESRFSLADFEKELLQGIVYTYDFGDNWQHVIMLEKVMAECDSPGYPVLLEGAGACPPEDLGGVSMYQELLKYLTDPEGDEELKEIFAGAGLDGFDPNFFSVDEINTLFKKLYAK